MYDACVMSVLLYGSECWVPLRRDLRSLNSFHHRCVSTVLGITSQSKWEECISSDIVREQWEDVETIEIIADEAISRVARTSGPNARPQNSQDVPNWMVAPDTALWRSKKEVEGHGKEGPEACKGW